MWHPACCGLGWTPAGNDAVGWGHLQTCLQKLPAQPDILPQPLHEMKTQQGSESKQHFLFYLSQKQLWRLLEERETSDVQ